MSTAEFVTQFPSQADSSILTPRELGREGERIAAEYLRACGYQILDRNWRWRGPDVRGELDIVALSTNILVPVEVKTRRTGPAPGAARGTGSGVGGAAGAANAAGAGPRTGHRPLDAITEAKRFRLWRLANRWLAEHRLDPDFRDHCPGSIRSIRVDVIGLLFPEDGATEPLIDHLRAV